MDLVALKGRDTPKVAGSVLACPFKPRAQNALSLPALLRFFWHPNSLPRIEADILFDAKIPSLREVAFTIADGGGSDPVLNRPFCCAAVVRL